MAAIDFDATVAPVDLVAGAGLSQGTTYTCQNASTLATLFLREAASVPAATARAFRVEAGGAFSITPRGDPIYVWTDDAGGCPLIVDEAA